MLPPPPSDDADAAHGALGRRDFLKHGVVAGGALAAANLTRPFASVAAGLRKLPVDGLLSAQPADSPIDHVVVLMMENRSFDHYFGWLAQDAGYIERGRSRHGRTFRVNGDNSQAFRNPDGKVVPTYHLPNKTGEDNPYRGCHHPDPGHGWDEGRAQRDRGFLAEGSDNDEFALGYYRGEDIPFYASLARRFTVFDRYHCSLLAPTFPNREYLHSAQSGGIKDNSIPFDTLGFQWPTIWDRLIAAGVPAGYFFVDLPTTALWGPRLLPITSHIENYFARCASGTLPDVTFIDPGFTTGMRTDDHPYADIRAGQKLVLDYFKAFAESPHWESGVFLVTYDEWGGFFDHVKPPTLPDERASANDDENFGQTGFRVPTIMASPYCREGFVDHTLYDHTSILRFIEWRFLGAPPQGPGGDGWWLTDRDRHARNIAASLRLEGPNPEIHLPELPEVPVASRPCEGEELEGLPGAPGAAPDLAQPHAFENILHDGFFERMGYGKLIDLRPIPSL